MNFFIIIPGSGKNNPTSSSTKISHEPEAVPLATMAEIMNNVLPEHVQMANGTKKRGKDCVAEFMLY